jgi:hypothetical protein
VAGGGCPASGFVPRSHVVADVSRTGGIDSAYFGREAITEYFRRYAGSFEGYGWEGLRLTDLGWGKEELLAAMPRTMDFCHPEVERSAPEDGTIYRGRDGVRKRLEEWLESFDEYRYEVERIIDCGGDEVPIVATEVGRGAKSGAEVRSVNYEQLSRESRSAALHAHSRRERW